MMTLEDIRGHFRRHDPFSGHLGIDILEVGEGYAVAEMPLDARHRNGMGNAHGGAVFALVDMVFAALSNADGLYCVNAQDLRHRLPESGTDRPFARGGPATPGGQAPVDLRGPGDGRRRHACGRGHGHGLRNGRTLTLRGPPEGEKKNGYRGNMVCRRRGPFRCGAGFAAFRHVLVRPWRLGCGARPPCSPMNSGCRCWSSAWLPFFFCWPCAARWCGLSGAGPSFPPMRRPKGCRA